MSEKQQPPTSIETVRLGVISNASMVEDGKRRLTPNYNPQPIVFARGEGMYLYDVEGNRYLDMVAGIAVCSLGHAAPELAETLADQARKLWHTSNLYYNLNALQLSTALTSSSFADRVFFANSGAEANEAAVKLARRYMHVTDRVERKEIICAHKSFHGRTLAMIAATGQEKYREGFDPIPAGFSHVPYGDFEALRKAIGPKTAAVMLEPIQGEGGVIPAPQGYLKRVRELCSNEGILLILDEVQTGVGRTGTLWAYQQEGVVPDIMTLAKGLAGGIPIGAMLCNQEVAKGWEAGSHNSTFGGSPLAAACALAVLSRVSRTDFLNHVQRCGTYLSNRLQELVARHPDKALNERGRGLMRALVLRGNAKKFVEECLRRKVLVNAIGENVIRFVPPLVLGEVHIDEAFLVMDAVLKIL